MRIASLSSFLWLSGLLAQDPTVTGIVVDADGKPQGGAHVRAVSWVEPGVPVAAAAEVVADAEGRFVVPLGTAPGISIWAWSGRQASALVEAVPHMAALSLRLEPIGPSPMQVRGLDAWCDEGPLRARVLVPAHGPWSAPIELDGQGQGTLPACPPGDLFVELWTAREEPVARLPIERSDRGGTVTLLPPVSVPILVRDTAGRPLAGAVVRHRAAKALELSTDVFPVRSTPSWRQVGISDAEGRVLVRLPLPCDPMTKPEDERLDCEFAVALPDHALGWAGFSGGAFADGGGVELDDGVLPITLREQDPTTVRVLAGGKPVAGLPVRLLARSTMSSLGGMSISFRMAEWQADATTDADGVATFAEVPIEASELRLVPLRTDPALPGFVPVPVGSLPDVELTQSRVVSVRVVDAAGKPAAGIRGHWMASPPDLMFMEPRGPEPRFSTDSTGVAKVRLADGKWWVWVDDGQRFAHALFLVGDTEGSRLPEIQLQLQPLALWSVVVKSADGTPAVGARFDLAGGEWIDGTPIPPADELQPQQFAGDLDFRMVKIGRADREGRLALRFLPPKVGHTFGRVALGDLRSEELRLDPARLPATIVVRAP